MVANRKMTGRASSIPNGLAVGALSGLVISIFASVTAAYLISAEILAQDKIGYCAMVVLMLASFVGAMVADRRIKKMPIQMAAISGLLLYLILLSMTALFFGGQYEGMGVTLLIVMIGSGAGGILSTCIPKRRKQKYHKI